MNSVNFSPNNYNPDLINESQYNNTENDDQIRDSQISGNNNSESKNRRNKKTKTSDKKNPLIDIFTNRNTHTYIGLVLIFIAGYFAITSISHINNGIEDQSTITNNTILASANDNNPTQNIGGSFGAYFSQLVLSQWLGIGSFILIFYIGALGLCLLRVIKLKVWSLTFKCLILAISISLVLGLLTYNSNNPLFLGGLHGFYISDFLIKTTGTLGAILINILIVILVAFIFINELRIFYKAYKERIAPHIPLSKLEDDGYENGAKQEEDNTSITKNEKQDQIEEENLDEVETSPIQVQFEAEDVKIDENTLIKDDLKTYTPGISIDENMDETSEDEVSLHINAPSIEIAEEISNDVYDPTAELSRYRFPTLDLLIERIIKENSVDQQEQEENKDRITKTLKDYAIDISHIEATVGPTVTLYEIIPAEGVRIAKIKRLEDDIALSLAALGIRIIAPIPGKGTIGIEVPNKDPQTVSFRSIIASKKFQDCKYALPMAMGATISNDVFIADLTKMPHLLVAGATGQGKSVGLNAIIASLLYKKHPAELKFVLIDPKMVEFSLYSKLERHYLAKLPDEEEAIITDPSKVVTTLNSLCIEMDNRYNLLRDANVRSIAEYNAKFISRKLNPEKGHKYLPYIVMIVDEFADLIMTAGKEVETPIARIAQKARAVGMHMIIATQRPSTNVITGIIKANFPGRIAFRVSQMVDSKTILDRTGANQLIGRGDMLFSHNGDMQRVQCAFIDTPEVEAICDCIDEQIGYEHAYYLPEYIPDTNDNITTGNITDRDPLFEEAARFIINSQTASTSSLQRRYSIGYNRAGKIMDQMEYAGIVGPSQGGKPRQVLIDSIQLERIIESYN